MFDLSPIQVLIVLGIALVVFGPRRLPELGRTLARGLREFRSATQLSVSDDAPPAPTKEPAAPEPADENVLPGVIVPGDAPPPSDDADGEGGHRGASA